MEKFSIKTDSHTQMLPITALVQETVAASGIAAGLCHIYVPHTTAAVTINENADPMVVHDVLHCFDRLVPWTDPAYRHMEDNSAAHVKAILFGTSQSLPIEEGKLVLGTWQGIFFCEFDGPKNRQFYVKLMSG